MADTRSAKHAILFYGGFAFRSGGAFMHTTTLSQGLRARGWTVTTITLDNLPWPLRYVPHVVAALVNKVAAPLGFYYKGILTGALYKFFIKRRSTDLLVFEDIYLGWNSSNPTVSVLHAVWSDNLQSYAVAEDEIAKLKRKEVEAINSRSHPVITVSQRYKEFLENAHFRDSGTISLDVVELGLDVDAIRAREKPLPPKHARSLIYCGALEARKNVYFMLDVFKHIAAADPLATLTIVGDGPDQEGLKQYAAEHRLNVAFLGRLTHDQVLDELTRHNIYIHTALKESFSFALLEAKLCGLTTCALASLEVPDEFVDLGFSGFDPADWSAQILAIDGKPDMRGFPDYSIARMTDHTLALVSSSNHPAEASPISPA